MRLPRDLSGAKLVKLLGDLGYAVTRQKGSHIRLTTQQNGEHHVTIPNHDPLRIGTLRAHTGSRRCPFRHDCGRTRPATLWTQTLIPPQPRMQIKITMMKEMDALTALLEGEEVEA